MLIRTILVIALFALSTIGFLEPRLALADPLKIHIGWIASPPVNLTSVLFAKPGVARHNGVSYAFEPIYFRGATIQIPALARGDLDVASLGFSALNTAVQNGGLSDLRVIADGAAVDGALGYFSTQYMVRKDSQIRTVADLKGKVIAVSGLGGAGDTTIKYMLLKHGLRDRIDYSILEVGFPQMKAMLLEKKADLVVATLPFAQDPALLENGRTLFTTTDAIGPISGGLWVARVGFIEKNRAALVDLLEDFVRANRWYLDPANHAEALEIISSATKVPVSAMASYVLTSKDYYHEPNGMPDLAAVQRTMQAQKEVGLAREAIDVVKFAELSILKEAIQRVK